MIYLLVFGILLVGILFDKEKESKNAKIWWIVEWLVLVLLMGFRYRVGADSLGYEDMYPQMETFSDLVRINDWTELRYMPLWHIFVALCLSFSDEFVVLQMIEAVIVNSIIFWFIKKYANRPFLTVLFYFFMIYPYYNTEIQRQVLSVCCFLLGIPSLIKGKYIRYYLWSIVGLGFHHSSVFILIIPPVYSYMKNMGTKSTISFLLIFVVGLVFVTQLDTVSSLMKYMGMIQLSSSMSHNDVNHTTLIGVIYRLLTEWLLVCLFLIVCKNQKKEEKAFLAIYVFTAGIAIPVYLMYRVIDFLWIPLYIIILNNLDRFVLSKNSIGREHKRKRLFYGVLSVLVVLNVFITRIQYYTLDREEITNKKGTYMYNMYIPYHSVFDPEKDDVREDLHYNDAIAF